MLIWCTNKIVCVRLLLCSGLKCYKFAIIIIPNCVFSLPSRSLSLSSLVRVFSPLLSGRASFSPKWGISTQISPFSSTMEQEVVNSLQHLSLTKEEETLIPILDHSRADLLEECSLSLFGRLLTDRQQNTRAMKNTLKVAWKMGSDLRIFEVGNNTFQFKFSS